MVAENIINIYPFSILSEAKNFSATSLYEPLDVTCRFPYQYKILGAAFEFCEIFFFINDPKVNQPLLTSVTNFCYLLLLLTSATNFCF
jgi:hypothetical protein